MKEKKSIKKEKSTKKETILKIILELLIIVLIGIIVFMGYLLTIQETNKKELQNETFEIQEDTLSSIYNLTKYKKPIIIFAESDGCHYCQEMQPYVKELYNKYKGKVIIKSVNVDKNSAIKDAYQIKAFPDLILINADGTPYQPGVEMGLSYNCGKENDKLVYTKIIGKIEEDQLENIILDMLEK